MGSSSKKPVKGFAYYLGMHMVLCHGPINAVKKILVDDREAWTGNATGGQININAPGLFGGDDREGGVSGAVDIEMGGATQGQNSYLLARLGSGIPHYRGVVGIVLRGCYIGMSSYLKYWKFRCTRNTITTDGSPIWRSDLSAIGDDMNPAHIIYECLTDRQWGMGYAATDIDEVAFASAAGALKNEGFGLSLLWDAQASIEDFIVEILSTIDASLFVDNRTGKFVLKLIRDNFDEDTIPVFDETNVIKISDGKRPLAGELTNSVTIQFWDATTGKDSSITVQDTAMIYQSGNVINAKLEYAGITNLTNAQKVAARELRALSTSMFSCKIHTTRAAHALEVGDPFKLSWPDYGITDMVMRVAKIQRGGPTSAEIVIQATQDVFSIGDTVTDAGETEWVPISGDPVPVDVFKAFSAGYFDAYQFGGSALASDLGADGTALAVCAASPSAASMFANLWTYGASGAFEKRVEVQFSPTCVLTAPMTQTQTSIAVTGGNALSTAVIGRYIMVDSEIMRLDGVTDTVLTVGRGCLDTVPQAHLSGARVYFPGEDLSTDDVQYLPGETVEFRLTPVATGGELAVSAVPSQYVTLDKRVQRPYAPGNFRIEGTAYPASVPDGDIDVTWSHRDRTLQVTEYLHDTLFGNIGPEAGTTYTVGLYTSGGVLVEEATGVTGTLHTFSASTVAGMTEGRIKLKAVRGGVDSWQEHDWTFDIV